MPLIKRTCTAAVLATAAVAALTGCQTSSSNETPGPVEPTNVEVPTDHEMTVEDLHDNDEDDTDIDRASIVCVDGSAFLYVYTSSYFKQGGPSIERFPEQDASCDGADGSAATPAEN